MSDDKIFDFGFSMTSEEEIKKFEKDQINEKNQELTKTQLKLQGLKQMIWPLLEELKTRDPTKSHIYWPDRAAKIAEFQKRIEDYIAGSR
jgi:hypothetical protein